MFSGIQRFLLCHCYIFTCPEICTESVVIPLPLSGGGEKEGSRYAIGAYSIRGSQRGLQTGRKAPKLGDPDLNTGNGTKSGQG